MEILDEDLKLIKNWRTFQDRVKSFENKSNISLFKEIYKEDAQRLIEHFVYRCNKNYLIFETFLTRKQLNDTLIFILKDNRFGR